MLCYEVVDDNWEYKHIPNDLITVITLCGFVDVDNREVIGKPTCPICIAHVKYCKKIKLAK
jgi:hypothetical protein